MWKAEFARREKARAVIPNLLDLGMLKESGEAVLSHTPIPYSTTGILVVSSRAEEVADKDNNIFSLYISVHTGRSDRSRGQYLS
jgi:hypothetical protein